MSALSDIQTALQNGVQAMGDLVTVQAKMAPTDTSGQLSADALVLSGFVRILGLSVVAGTAVGALHDAATIADAAAGNEVYEVPTTKGFYPLHILVTNGLVFKLGTANRVVIFYSRT